MQGECTLDDKYGNKHHLKRIETSEAVETLGVYLAMDENSNKHREELKKKADKFAEQISKSNCDPNTALYTYRSCFMKSIDYSLVVSDFTGKELNSINCNAKRKSLHKAHIAANFPNDVLYGPQLYNRMGLDNLCYHQGIKKNQYLDPRMFYKHSSRQLNKSGCRRFLYRFRL